MRVGSIRNPHIRAYNDLSRLGVSERFRLEGIIKPRYSHIALTILYTNYDEYFNVCAYSIVCECVSRSLYLDHEDCWLLSSRIDDFKRSMVDKF